METGNDVTRIPQDGRQVCRGGHQTERDPVTPLSAPDTRSADTRSTVDTQVWSTEVRVAVATGFRRLSLLPTPSGSLLVVDSTGAGGYGQLVLGEVHPQDSGHVMAVDPHGVDVGSGTMTEMVRRLFDRHPATGGLLDRGTHCGVDGDRGSDGDSGMDDSIPARAVAAMEVC